MVRNDTFQLSSILILQVYIFKKHLRFYFHRTLNLVRCEYPKDRIHGLRTSWLGDFGMNT